MFKYAVFDIKPTYITKFSSQIPRCLITVNRNFVWECGPNLGLGERGGGLALGSAVLKTRERGLNG